MAENINDTVDAHAIKFRISLNHDFINMHETVYMSMKEFDKLPVDDIYSGWGCKNTDAIIPEYFTKEKIEEYKKNLCEQIMNSDNPFYIQEADLDCYPIEKSRIWK